MRLKKKAERGGTTLWHYISSKLLGNLSVGVERYLCDRRISFLTTRQGEDRNVNITEYRGGANASNSLLWVFSRCSTPSFLFITGLSLKFPRVFSNGQACSYHSASPDWSFSIVLKRLLPYLCTVCQPTQPMWAFINDYSNAAFVDAPSPQTSLWPPPRPSSRRTLHGPIPTIPLQVMHAASLSSHPQSRPKKGTLSSRLFAKDSLLNVVLCFPSRELPGPCKAAPPYPASKAEADHRLKSLARFFTNFPLA